MDLTSALRAFVRTVERGSVTAAARDLAISQPAVSKHLANLERRTRARLLERSFRLVRPTPAGRALYEASRQALASIDAAIESLHADDGVLDGTIRVHAPSCLGGNLLHPIVMDFRKRHPAALVDLVLENRVVDLVHDNYDMAFRFGRPETQEAIVRRVGSVRRILVASPDFLRRSGPIDDPARLSDVDLVVTFTVLSPRGGLQLLKGAETVEIEVKPVLRTNDARALSRTLLDGHAAGPVQEHLVVGDLQAGRLVRILPDFEVRSSELFVTYPSVRFMRPIVRVFADFAVDRLAVETAPGGVEAADLLKR